MNQIIPFGNSPITMTSREIAELTGKKHQHVMRDIRVMVEALEQSPNLVFVCNQTSYLSDNGQEYPQYELDKDACMTLMLGYDVVARMKVVKRLQELESGLIPQTLPDALRLAADLAEQKALLEAQIIEDAPKVEFYHDVAGSEDLIDMATVAKVLNISGFGRNKLFAFLRDSNVLNARNEPYQRYVDLGWFKLIETKYQKPNGNWHINIKTMVYQRGVDGIRKLLKKELEVAHELEIV